MLSAALSSATQHAMPPEFGRKWGTEWLNTRFLLPTLPYAGYNVKLYIYLLSIISIIYYLYLLSISSIYLLSWTGISTNQLICNYLKDKRRQFYSNNTQENTRPQSLLHYSVKVVRYCVIYIINRIIFNYGSQVKYFFL